MLAQDERLWNEVCALVLEMKPEALAVDTSRDCVRGATIVASRLTDVLVLDLDELLVVRINFPSIVRSICQLAAERMVHNARLLGQLEARPGPDAPAPCMGNKHLLPRAQALPQSGVAGMTPVLERAMGCAPLAPPSDPKQNELEA